MTNFNKYVSLYKDLIRDGNIQQGYMGLLKYTSSLKAHFLKSPLSDKFSFGNMSHGYMDYSYFPFFDEKMRKCKLRFGIVLNHGDMRFELWLMGQNADVQDKYWDLLKSTKWNKDRTTKPKYSVLEVVLVQNPNFDQLDALTLSIEREVNRLVPEILDYLNEKSDK